MLAGDVIVINEIHTDPDIKTEPVEFIELHNAGDTEVDLSGWLLTEAVDFHFPGDTVLDAGGYLVVSENPVAVRGKFGVELRPGTPRHRGDAGQRPRR